MLAFEEARELSPRASFQALGTSGVRRRHVYEERLHLVRVPSHSAHSLHVLPRAVQLDRFRLLQ